MHSELTSQDLKLMREELDPLGASNCAPNCWRR